MALVVPDIDGDDRVHGDGDGRRIEQSDGARAPKAELDDGGEQHKLPFCKDLRKKPPQTCSPSTRSAVHTERTIVRCAQLLDAGQGVRKHWGQAMRIAWF